MTDYTRRNYFVKKGFQSRFIFWFLLFSCLTMAVSIGVFTWIANREMETALYSMRISETIMDAFFKEALIANLAAVGTVLIILILTTKQIYRTVSEPLTALQHRLWSMRDGDLRGRIYLRPGDEFQDFADQINAMSAELNEKFSLIGCHVRQLDRRVWDLTWSSEEKNKKLLIEMIMAQISAIEDQLKTFKR